MIANKASDSGKNATNVAMIIDATLLETQPASPAAQQLTNDTALMNQLRNAIEAASDDDGWAALGRKPRPRQTCCPCSAADGHVAQVVPQVAQCWVDLVGQALDEGDDFGAGVAADGVDKQAAAGGRSG